MSKNSHAKHELKQKHRPQNNSYQVPHEDYHAGAFGDIIIVLLIIGLGLFFVAPFYQYMNSGSLIFVITVFALIILLFAVFVWRKRRRK